MTLAKDMRLKAMDLLARREHSRYELGNKLRLRFEVEQSLLNSVLDVLAADGLQSDVRFCESYIRVRAGRGYGPQRLQQELRQRGVDDACIDNAIDQYDIDWPAQAQQQLVKKFGEAPPGDYKERAKRMRFLQYKGYSQQHIHLALVTLWPNSAP